MLVSLTWRVTLGGLIGGPYKSFGIRLSAYPPVPTSTKSWLVARNIEIFVITFAPELISTPARVIIPFPTAVVNGRSSSISAKLCPVTDVGRYPTI